MSEQDSREKTMRKRRCIFCMQEIEAEEQKCPFCKKALWQYAWNPGWIKPYTRLKNRYMIGRVLGEGAFGVTYLAYDETEGSPVAVKVYSGSGHSEEGAILEKAGEIPGIVAEKEFFQENGICCLVMEYLDGGSLKDYMKKHRLTTAESAAEMIHPVMEALVFLHSQGILHGDISPDNLLFDRNGALKLVDFGAAIQKGKARSEKKLKEGYAPVEQYQDREKTGPWTDLYALCAVWYEMVTGHKVPPALQRIKKDSLRAPGSYVKVPEKVEQVFMRGLSVDIQRRYFSVVNLLNLLFVTEKRRDIEEEKIRKIWGEIWIFVTTEVERDSALNVKKGRLRKRLRITAGALLGLAAAAALISGGLWIYCDTHPEKVLAYELEKDWEDAENLENNTVLELNSEFSDILEFMKKNAYESDENEYISTYRFSPDALTGWKYPGRKAGRFPIKADTVKKAADLFADARRENENTAFNGYVEVSHHLERNPLYINLNWEESWYYGEDRVGIYYDYVTEFVTYVSFHSPETERVVAFLHEMLPVISPESYLTEQEIYNLLQTAEDKGEYISVNLNAKCQVSIDIFDDEFTATVSAE